MGLWLHRSSGSGALVQELAKFYAARPTEVLGTELIVVPTLGLERWLSQQLSHELGATASGAGICAGFKFLTPRQLQQLCLPVEIPSSEQLTWPVLQTLLAASSQPWAEILTKHLALTNSRRYEVARGIAELFSNYLWQRPQMLNDWEAGKSTDGIKAELPVDLAWQPELWRNLVAQLGYSPVQQLQQALHQLTVSKSTQLPSRVSWFGHTRLTAFELNLISAISTQQQVHFWLAHPAPALWQEMVSMKCEIGPRNQDLSFLAAANPLLASLSRDVRELQLSLQTLTGWQETPATAASYPQTLLGQLQTGLSNNLAVKKVAINLDDSLQFHACHGAHRQVEVLRELILGLLADDPTLEPRDIVVMCPQIDEYAPLITAAFGAGSEQANPHPGQLLPIKLADRSLLQTNEILAVLTQLLEIANSRFEAAKILDLISTPAVQRRFKFSDSELETITNWLAAVGVKWGLDQQTRKAEYGLDFVHNTWQFGVDRVVAGVALSAEAEAWLGATLPLDAVGSSEIDLAGRLAELFNRLAGLHQVAKQAHSAQVWQEILTDLVQKFAEPEYQADWQTAQLHRELAGLGGSEISLRLSDLKAMLQYRSGGRPTRANFRTGALTFCTLTPMRSVPHRVICLLGMDDGAFPRQNQPSGDDILARNPLVGERDPRIEDRQLLLDAILAAQEKLVVLYSGFSPVSGNPLQPAVPIQELIQQAQQLLPDSVGLIREHSLQPYHPINLTSNTRPEPFSFDASALAASQVVPAPKPALSSLQTAPLPAAEISEVNWSDLVNFIKDPVQEFYKKRLEISVWDEETVPNDQLLISLDGLQKWQIGDRVLADLVAGKSKEFVLDKEWRQGQLPPGKLGWRQLNQIVNEAMPIANQITAATRGLVAKSLEINLRLPSGRSLSGVVSGVYGDRVVQASFAKLGPRQYLENYLAMALLTEQYGGVWSAHVFGKPTAWGNSASFQQTPDMLQHLDLLTQVYLAGMTAPMLFPMQTSYRYAVKRSRGASEQLALQAADKFWSGKFGDNKADTVIDLIGPDARIEQLLQTPDLPGVPVSADPHFFGALATAVWVPVIKSGGLSG